MPRRHAANASRKPYDRDAQPERQRRASGASSPVEPAHGQHRAQRPAQRARERRAARRRARAPSARAARDDHVRAGHHRARSRGSARASGSWPTVSAAIAMREHRRHRQQRARARRADPLLAEMFRNVQPARKCSTPGRGEGQRAPTPARRRAERVLGSRRSPRAARPRAIAIFRNVETYGVHVPDRAGLSVWNSPNPTPDAAATTAPLTAGGDGVLRGLVVLLAAS